MERVHQTLASMIHSQDIENSTLDEKDPWIDILNKCAWAIRSTVHMTLNVTPAQVVFGCDMLFDLVWKVNFNDLQER